MTAWRQWGDRAPDNPASRKLKPATGRPITASEPPNGEEVPLEARESPEMPANPNANPLLVLLDLVASPLLLFNADGHVVFGNQAAKQMACRPALVLGSDPGVRSLVRDLAADKMVLRLQMRVDAMSDNGVARLQCQFAPRPIAGLVAVAVSELPPDEPPAEAQEAPPVVEQRLSLQQIMELLRADLMKPILHVLSQDIPQEHRPLAESVRELRERLERLSDLVNVFGEDMLIGEDRILIPDLVREVAQDLSHLMQKHRVHLAFEGDREDLPPVYGSTRLIRRALYECLHNAVEHARDGVHTPESVAIGVAYRSGGSHLMVHIHNMGVLSAATLTHHAAAIFRPTPVQSGEAALEQDRLRIGLPLTRRILQLHGGSLRIEQDTAGELDVMLELPTGAPLRNNHHLDLLQAQIYAEDLSKLMARTRKRSTP